MKLLHSLLMLVLATVCITTQTKVQRSDAELPRRPYWESENVFVIPDEPLTPEQQAEQDRFEELADLRESSKSTYEANPVNTSSYSNHTLATREDKWYAELWMSDKRVNIGTLRGPRLYWKLFYCFQALCPQTDTHWECNNKPSEFGTNQCKIENIVSTKHDNAYDATSDVKVSFTLVKNDYGTNLSPPTVHENLHCQYQEEPHMLTLEQYDMLAAMVSFMTEEDGNCHWVEFEHSRRTKLCNIAHRALVAFPMNDGKSDPYTVFIATFEMANNRFEEGEFHCNDSLKKRTYDFFHNSAKHNFTKATHNSVKGYIDAHVKCQQEEECFAYNKWRNCYDKGR